MNKEAFTKLEHYSMLLNEFAYPTEEITDDASYLMNCQRKIIDIYLIMLKNKNIINFNTEGLSFHVGIKNYRYVSVEDSILAEAVECSLTQYGWYIDEELNYRNDEQIIFPGWFKEKVIGMLSEVTLEELEDEEDHEAFLSNYLKEYIVVTISNKKLSYIVNFSNKCVTFDELFTQLMSSVNDIPLYTLESTTFCNFTHESNYYLSILYDELTDDYANDYTHISVGKYYNPGIIYRLKEIDDIMNELIIKYNIPYLKELL